eukprot:gene8404-9304_t
MTQPRYPCGICHKNVNSNQAAIYCNECNSYVHIKCNDISPAEYKVYQDESDNVAWFCMKCTEALFPFGSLEFEELSHLYDFDLPSFVDSALSFDVTSNLRNLPNLDDYDIDEQLSSNVNSNYHSPGDLANLCSSDSDLSLFHMNIRSLSCHYDELVSTLVNLKVNFDVVAVSELWHTFDNPISLNVEIPGYKLFLAQSHSQNGGVGLYVKSCLNPILRMDLSKGSIDYETVWVEVENRNGKNYLFCCAYRHPNSNVENFTSYLQEILSMQRRLLPYVVHPSRVSGNSSSLIDNIFSNTCEQETSNSNNVKQLWSGIRSIIDIKKSKENAITKIKDSSGNVTSDPA